MKLKVLGSSSKGNCYILENDTSALIIEAGVSIKKILQSINFDLNKVVGCIYSHSHGDHSKDLMKLAEKSIKCYGSSEIFKHHNIHVVEEKKQFSLGEFQIIPLPVKHDVKCFMYLIKHPETGVFIFATDNYNIPYKFENLNNIMIESNYDYDILQENCETGKVIPIVANRVIKSHMSIKTCKNWLKANDLKAVNNIVLLHLSESNANAKKFQKEIIESTGKTVYVAEPGLEINFNKTPF